MKTTKGTVNSSQKKAEELEDRMIDFAIRIGAVAEALPSTKLGKHIAGQIIRCGTSPAPNYGEADAGESINDFVHKLGVAYKELRETRVWLKMIIRGKMLPDRRMTTVLDECQQLCNILAASIKTANQIAETPFNPNRFAVPSAISTLKFPMKLS